MTMELRSSAFANGERIPERYSQDGASASPPLEWSGVPDNAAELALIVDDPDAPREKPFVHWLIYKIPPDVSGLPEDIPNEYEPGVPADVFQGDNTKGTIGYVGPRPPEGHGVHRYHFKLYALDEELEVSVGLDKEALLAAMEGHVIDEGELIGTYER